MSNEKRSFFTKLLDFFLNADNPEVIKKRRLKEIAKNIGKTKYSKFYKSSSQELSPKFAGFFYSIYKVVGPARPLLAGAAKSKILRQITIENSLSKEQKTILTNISEERISERAKKEDSTKLVNSVKQALKTFVLEFDSKKIEKIDLLYEQVDGFINFVLFDYYFLLRKFDTRIVENNFAFTPSFKTIKGEFVIEELKDFAVALNHLNLETRWEDVYSILKKYKNIQPVHETQWKKIVHLLQDLKRSKVLENIIKHISEDIFYKTETIPALDKITESYVANVQKHTKNSINKILKQQKNQNTEILVTRIFGRKLTPEMKNYSVENSKPFINKGLAGFSYAEEMGYLNCFLTEYVITDIRSLCDLFLVRGDWGGSAGLTSDYSESFHSIMHISEQIIKFDKNLEEASSTAIKFRTLLSRMDREKEAARQVTKLLNEVNEEARDILNKALKDLIVIGNNFKNIITDYDKPRRTLLQNWKEIEHNSEQPIRKWLVVTYKRIYDFITLIKLFRK